MKILHVTTSLYGGAAIAARRINRALNVAGESSSVLSSLYPDWDIPFHYKVLRKGINTILGRRHTANPVGCFSHNFFSAEPVLSLINSSDAEVVNLHWIGNNLLSIKDISRIRKPLVWTLHDTWAQCGTEHYPNVLENDRRYIDGYSRHNFPVSSSGIDVDKWVWLWKKHCWKNLQVHFVAPSGWMARSVRESALFGKYPCSLIPNALPVDCFRPLDRMEQRRRWGIPESRRVILCGADSLDNRVKGFSYLLEALGLLRQQRLLDEVTLVSFGRHAGPLSGLDMDCRNCGFVDSEEAMASLYNAADLFVCPSIIENLPSTCIEAILCGTPVAAFRTGGVPDIISPGINGQLAQPFEPQSLAEAMLAGLALGRVDSAAFAARYEPRAVAEQYLALYRQILADR